MLGLPQTDSVDREESEVSSTTSYPVQDSELSFRELVPDTEEEKNKDKQRSEKTGKDEETDVRITNHIHPSLD